jgi:hypothetical protein
MVTDAFKNRYRMSCYDSKDSYDEDAHPGDCDGLIFAHAPHDIWTLLNIIKTMRSEISNKQS